MHDNGPVLTLSLAAASILANFLAITDIDVQALLHILQCGAAAVAIVLGIKTMFFNKMKIK